VRRSSANGKWCAKRPSMATLRRSQLGMLLRDRPGAFYKIMPKAVKVYRKAAQSGYPAAQ